MTSLRAAALAILTGLMVTGCLFTKAEPDKPELPTYPPAVLGGYVAALQDPFEGETPPKVGIVGRDLAVREATATSFEPQPITSIELASIDDARICFATSDSWATRAKPVEEVIATQQAALASPLIMVRAVSSLAAEREAPMWPAPADAVLIDQVELVSDQVEEYDADDGTIQKRRVVRMRTCGLRPAITDETRFLAVTLHYRDEKSSDANWMPIEPDGDIYDTVATRARYRKRAERNNLRLRLEDDALLLFAVSDDGSYDLSR